jgi:hypothetical protein
MSYSRIAASLHNFIPIRYRNLFGNSTQQRWILQFLLYSTVKSWFDGFIAWGATACSRDASNDVPNRRYLARRLIGSAAMAKLFAFANLPPSMRGWEGDCGGLNQRVAYERKVVSLRRRLLIQGFRFRLRRSRLFPPSNHGLK